MTLDQLKTFLGVAKAQSFQKAAESLHLTQPAVSKQIRALENELGERLLERGRKTQVTQAGEVLLKYAQQATQAVHDAREALDDLRNRCTGRLSVAASHSIALYLLPSLLEAYRARYPGVTVTISGGYPAEILRRVGAGDFDLGLVTLVTRKLDDALPLKRMPFAATEIVLVASPSNAVAKRKALTIDELRHVSWILSPDGCQYRGYLEKKLAEQGLAMNVAVEVIGLEVQKKLAQLDLGATLLPQPFVAQELKTGTLARLDVKGVRLRSFSCLVYRRDKHVHRAMRGFLEILGEVAGREAGPAGSFPL